MHAHVHVCGVQKGRRTFIDAHVEGMRSVVVDVIISCIAPLFPFRERQPAAYRRFTNRACTCHMWQLFFPRLALTSELMAMCPQVI